MEVVRNMRAVCGVLALFGLLMAADAVGLRRTTGVATSRELAGRGDEVLQRDDNEPGAATKELAETYYYSEECASTVEECVLDVKLDERCSAADSEFFDTECCDALIDWLVCVSDVCPDAFDYYISFYEDQCDFPDELPPEAPPTKEFPPEILACFSASSQVRLEDGSVKTMEELAVGDRVQTGTDTFSEVFSWSHRDPAAEASFRRIHAGDRHIEVTGSHYLLVNGKLVAAESIQRGDFLQLGDGGEAEVTSIETIYLKGLYNPHTLDGQIVVNGLTASIYTRAVPPVLAHYLLAVPRLLYRLGLGDVLGSYLHGAAPSIARVIPRGSIAYN